MTAFLTLMHFDSIANKSSVSKSQQHSISADFEAQFFVQSYGCSILCQHSKKPNSPNALFFHLFGIIRLLLISHVDVQTQKTSVIKRTLASFCEVKRKSLELARRIKLTKRPEEYI
jgi:hypothetical protein